MGNFITCLLAAKVANCGQQWVVVVVVDVPLRAYAFWLC